MTFEEQVKRLVRHPEKITTTTLSRDVFADVAREMAEEHRKNMGDKHLQRRAEDWSVLAHQVVDAETF